MNFKEAYLEDLEEIFFDTEEFASKHVIDGKTMTVVLTDVTLESAKTNAERKSALNPKEGAVNKSGIVLYIQEKDVERKFTANSMINLDGKKLFIYDVKHFDGVYKLTVGTYRV